MRKNIIKTVVLLVVFWATVAVMQLMGQQNNMDLTSEMAQATLPVVSMQRDGYKINELYGYRSKMDGTAMRDSITPLREDLSLPVVVKPYQNQVEKISYEVRTLDMERLIANGSVGRLTEEKGEIAFTLRFQNILEEGMEYVLVLSVECGENPVYYYTRIARDTGSYVKESLDFAMNFHELTFDRENADSLATYLEPDNLEDNDTLSRVSIHSSLNQICWAGFEGERLEKPMISIKEMGAYSNALTLRYVLTSAGEGGEVEYYNVEEYYRVRYNSQNSRMYLLNYERTMDQIFRGENGTVDGEGLLLGIRSEDVEYKGNEKGDVVAFVQEGELWSYESAGNEFSQVYSFRSPEGISSRENNDSHQIKIMRVDETGSIDFVVYGYMNRGAHEGRSGINVFHYDNVGKTVEEELFLPSDKSFDRLGVDWGNLFYISKENIFYLLAEDSLYRIDLTAMETSRIVEGLPRGGYAVSEDGRFLAWQPEEEDGGAPILKVLDLEGEQEHSIEGAPGERLKPIGFVESDFVYGTAREGDAETDSMGNASLPMYKVTIVDKNSKEIKTYQKDGYYIPNAYVEDETIFLDRAVRTEAGYVGAEQDTIKSQQLEAGRMAEIATSQTEKKQRQVYLALRTGTQEDGGRPRVVVPKSVVLKEKRTVRLDTGKKQENYYVYEKGRILLATSSLAEAIRCADENMGVAVGSGQEYIWRRGKSASQPTIGDGTADLAGVSEDPVARCLSYLLHTEGASVDVDNLLADGKTPGQIMEKALPDRKVLDLAGCSLDEALYYVSLGTPVLALADGKAYLIVGYDEHNAILYDPDSNEARKMGLLDSNDLFGNAGNLFLGYL